MEGLMMEKINIGKYVEAAIEWLSIKGAPVFDAINNGVEALVEGFQNLLLAPHPLVVIFLIAALGYYLGAGRKNLLKRAGWKEAGGVLLFTIFGLLLLWGMNFWEETMQTLTLVIVSTLIALLIGIPLGIWSARSDRAQRTIRPILDFMQTMPAFVYLIPAILFFSVGNVPGVVATVVFALPPGVRLTNLGIRSVPKEVVEAAYSFGSTPRQVLYKVQIPLAKPSILAGVNQVIMLSLSMVVIASMVGAAGLGEKVYTGILKADIGLGFEAGLSIVILAIILDRISQSLGGTQKKESK
ncbi:glycine betaine/proline transport system permease protein [Ancylomarina subtilis]|uniref:Glycine betaine/proline transport system permease protein n=2 Tax=Ancylomarina subtilis TaxID=1639035 RepID=A0A4Q7V9A9_9BACT|nr:proline/glycine betaine ABC transporter permease [Ancylomarina subtilis]RZT91208.1 glycine betaine/proline transport system permease protein [Ancylomarina subtilis]